MRSEKPVNKPPIPMIYPGRAGGLAAGIYPPRPPIASSRWSYKKMRVATSYLPRIYSFPIQLSSSDSVPERALARCRAMGFDHVLIPSPGLGISDEALRRFAQACFKHKLALLTDLSLLAAQNDSILAESHPDWFVHGNADDELPDPRKPVRHDPVCRLRYEAPAVAQPLQEYWQRRITAWADAGVAGFRCVAMGDFPASFWRHLIESAKAAKPGLRFLAWTPGLTPEQLQGLAGAGFDASFSSSAWWDYRSRWLVEEQERLYRIAPPIAFPDAPEEAVIARAPGYEDPEVRRPIHIRALRLAAATGNGILMPAGFEFGIRAEEVDLSGAPEQAVFDISDEVAQANRFIAEQGPVYYGGRLRILTESHMPGSVMMREPAQQSNLAQALVIAANPDMLLPATVPERIMLERGGGFVCTRRIWPQQEEAEQTEHPVHLLHLRPCELQVFSAKSMPPILRPASRGKQAVNAAAKAPRIAIESVSPSVDGGQFAVKRTVGDLVQVEASIFMDGHEKLAASVWWRAVDEDDWHEVRMHALGNDRWAASFPVLRIGRYEFEVEAWRDVFANYRDELGKKSGAGLDVTVELEEGRLMIEAAARHAKAEGLAEAADYLGNLAKSMKPPTARSKNKVAMTDAERIAALLSEPTADAMRIADARPFSVRSEPVMRIEVDRTAARFSSWYELFPRSQSGDPHRHGTFGDVIKRLPAIQAMGFDTLYFPPIHPIGKKHRKGKNNSLNAGPDEPGSPYAIGSEEGGHDAIHPELGTIEDFRRMRDEAAKYGLELALDFAIQCSPDHPWLKEHPDWFNWRPDGTIKYAENPPKKYQDIVNVDFYAPGAVPDLWIALRDVVLFWVKEGVRVFRVDNPHTKSLPFWEWMIADIRARYPDTIFLSEAFTRPRMMYRLAKLGFTQSYTYFTWRHSKTEFIDYMNELAHTPVQDFFRPHFFVNTPDINPHFLQRSGRPGFLIRAALATTLSGLWGMYSGFELCEGTPVPGKEEYLDSEKYEIRAWDWEKPGNIIAEITQLNRLRRENPALQSHLGIRFYPAHDDNILYFAKTTPPTVPGRNLGDNVVLVAINLDPYNVHEATFEVPLWEFGLPDDAVLEVDDLVQGRHLTWHGKYQHIRLDPFSNPYAIWRVRQREI
jgi:starch synthase (maltosyl-transferring)